ncbi:hypothetical protein ACHHYP_04058 [Achlya hypogyna]|uniref:Arf-GAP domain-containing protein n=1 Tax=Achlya hypogyna TaxID=1202772 RepID=A0A1V9Z2G7_ACHHY|nr:hypothetical protein ACHHYP_04058 [Achlya hypogyna]
MAEAVLNTIRKLEANKACANCDTIAKFGHSNVCDKFKTFVCNNCKSAHQSYSHRVKSVTMSNWTMEEVDALKEENGGGNAVARRTWLGAWEEGRSMRKPTESDHVDVFKRFINAAYNDRAFYSENSAPKSAPRSQAPPSSSSSSSSRKEKASPAAPNADLLGFSPTATPAFEASFDAFSAPVQPASFEAFSAPVQPASFEAFSAPVQPASFEAFSAPVKPQAPLFDAFSAPVAPASSTSFDPFAAGAALPAPSSSNGNWGGFQAAPAAFDPFAAAIPPSLNAAGMPAAPQFGAAPAANANNYGGGHSISSLLDPSMVANPHAHAAPYSQQGHQSYGVAAPPHNIGYGYHLPMPAANGFQQPPASGQQGYGPPKSAAGRDPFAGLAFN